MLINILMFVMESLQTQLLIWQLSTAVKFVNLTLQYKHQPA